MRYYVQHKFGVSHEYNTYKQHPWHGAGQGTTDTALRYIVLSDTLIDTYHTKVTPAMIHDPTTMITIIQSLKAFIDDVVLHTANPAADNVQALTQQAETQIQWWDQLAKVTGGALNPKKCCGMAYH